VTRATRDLERVSVEVPPSDRSRDRVEARVFARLDAIRAAERAARLAVERPPGRAWQYLAAAVAIAAAVTLGISVRHEPERPAAAASVPSLIITPAGGSSRFTVGDAVIDAGSDTQVEVRAADQGPVAFVLARGTIDCDAAPGKGPPVRVRAGNAVVDAAGARFSVTRTAGVRVDVSRGEVRVRTRAGEVRVGPGERWSIGDEPAAVAVATSSVAPVPAEPAAPVPAAPVAGAAAIARPLTDGGDEIAVPAARRAAPRSSRDAFQAAQRLEPRDRRAAARAYRAVANGDDAWAALALYSLAELDVASGRRRDALVAVEEYARRFPRGAGIEDATWIRVETLRGLGRHDEARRAAASYLRQFPRGTYARPAARVAAPP